MKVRLERFGDTGEGLQSLDPAKLAQIADDKAKVATAAVEAAEREATGPSFSAAYIATNAAAIAFKMASQAAGDPWDVARQAWEAAAAEFMDLITDEAET